MTSEEVAGLLIYGMLAFAIVAPVLALGGPFARQEKRTGRRQPTGLAVAVHLVAAVLFVVSLLIRLAIRATIRGARWALGRPAREGAPTP